MIRTNKSSKIEVLAIHTTTVQLSVTTSDKVKSGSAREPHRKASADPQIS